MAKKTSKQTRRVALIGLSLMIIVGLIIVFVPDPFFEPERGVIPVTDPPTACILIFAPVCGENGLTYDNSCNAEVAGTTVKHEGMCRAESLFDQLVG